jgi:hypothetical protein
MRIASDLWHQLDEAARASGRSLSQEAEMRLGQTFQTQELLDQALTLAHGPRPAELMAALALVMQRVGAAAALNGEYSYDAMDRWTEIPYAFNEAFAAAVTILEGRRPQGGPEWPETLLGAPLLGPKREPGALGKKLARDALQHWPPRKSVRPDPAIVEQWERALKKASEAKAEEPGQ